MASRAFMGIYLAQELLALRLALEEGCSPGPGPPRELSFTKSSQAVRAVREVLTAACASQWEQLRGLGTEDGPQKLSTEGGCPVQVTHPSPGSQAPRPGAHLRAENGNCAWCRVGPKSCQCPEPPPRNDQSAPLAIGYGAEGASPRPPASFEEAGVQGASAAGSRTQGLHVNTELYLDAGRNWGSGERELGSQLRGAPS